MKDRINFKILKKMEEIPLELKFHPNDFEDLDQYSAFNKEYGVECFGSTKEEALENARAFLKELLFQNFELTR